MVLLPLCWICSCGNQPGDKSSMESAKTTSVSLRDSTLETIHTADSIEYHLVADPHKPFEDKVLMVTDIGLIGLLNESIQQGAILSDSCTSYNHKWYYFKKGEVFKTLYANTGKKDESSCRYVGWSSGGKKIYRTITPALDSLILQLSNRVDTLP